MISPFPPQISGGSKASYYFYRYLTKEYNHQIEILSYQRFQNKYVNVKSVALRGEESLLRGILFIILGFIKGVYLAKKFKPDILYSKHLMSPSITAYLISKFLRIPFVSHTAGSDTQNIEFTSSNLTSIFSDILYKIFSWLRLQVLKASSAIICNCKADFIALQDMYRNGKSVVIYNGIDLNKFKFKNEARKNVRDKYNLKDDEIVVIYTGQANKQKQTDILLNIIEENPEFKFLIVGPKKKELLKFGRVSSNIIITGPVYGNIEDFLSAADIFILPSMSEGLSNSLLEALSVSLPVIATPVGDTKYLINHKENGIISRIGDFSFWLNELVEKNSFTQKIKKNAREIIKNSFNWIKSTREISKVFEYVKKRQN